MSSFGCLCLDHVPPRRNLGDLLVDFWQGASWRVDEILHLYAIQHREVCEFTDPQRTLGCLDLGDHRLVEVVAVGRHTHGNFLLPPTPGHPQPTQRLPSLHLGIGPSGICYHTLILHAVDDTCAYSLRMRTRSGTTKRKPDDPPTCT